MVTGMEVISFSCVSAEKWEKAISSRLTKRGEKASCYFARSAANCINKKKRKKRKTVCAECCVTEES